MSSIQDFNDATTVRRSQPAARPESRRASDAAQNSDARSISRPSDRLDLSAAASQSTAAGERPAGARGERVNALRTEIDAGRYPSDEILDAALDRMIDDARRWFA
jgi:anti-sigma28 factor (negative regulator of flagellin synthesis)